MTSPVFASGTFNRPAMLRRSDAGRRDRKGRWQPSEAADEPITVIAQPADEHRENILGGARLVGAMFFYTEPSDAISEIKVASNPESDVQSDGDIIIYQGAEYRALAKIEWPDYVRVTAVRIEGQN